MVGYDYVYVRGYKRNFECFFKNFLRGKKVKFVYLFFGSRVKFGIIEFFCSRIYFVLGFLVVFFIFDDVVGVDLLGELILILVVVLCFCSKVFFN